MCEIVKLSQFELVRGLQWYEMQQQQQGKFVSNWQFSHIFVLALDNCNTFDNLLFFFQTKVCSEGKLSKENKSGIKNSIWAQQWDLFPLGTLFKTSFPLFLRQKRERLTHFPIIWKTKIIYPTKLTEGENYLTKKMIWKTKIIWKKHAGCSFYYWIYWIKEETFTLGML